MAGISVTSVTHTACASPWRAMAEMTGDAGDAGDAPGRALFGAPDHAQHAQILASMP